MMKILKLLLSALVAWTAGLAFISATLYFSNGGADFTTTDIMGFGVIAIVGSAVLMLLVYLPAVYFLKRRSGQLKPGKVALLTGVVCNLPVFVGLASLINQKMSLSEAVGFMVSFLIIGATFGFGVAASEESERHRHSPIPNSN